MLSRRASKKTARSSLGKQKKELNEQTCKHKDASIGLCYPCLSLLYQLFVPIINILSSYCTTFSDYTCIYDNFHGDKGFVNLFYTYRIIPETKWLWMVNFPYNHEGRGYYSTHTMIKFTHGCTENFLLSPCLTGAVVHHQFFVRGGKFLSSEVVWYMCVS